MVYMDVILNLAHSTNVLLLFSNFFETCRKQNLKPALTKSSYMLLRDKFLSHELSRKIVKTKHFQVAQIHNMKSPKLEESL